MDGNRFDDLTKAFISRRSRRSLIKGVAGSFAGLGAALLGRGAISPVARSNAATLVPCAITCPANITVSNDPNQCGAVVNYAAPTTTGDCVGGGTCNPPSGSFFPVGTTSVTCTAIELGTLLPRTCQFSVTVNDTQPPTITCPANITQPNDPNQCGAVVNYPPPTASDNCPGVTTVCSPASGSFFPVGTTTATCTATDAFGNTATCSFTVTVNDTQPPGITCPANITQGTDPGQCSAVVTFADPVVSDNCPGVTPPTCLPASGSSLPIGTATVTCSTGDASGNTASCSFTVTINDTEDPALTCPPDIVVDTAPGASSAIVEYADPTSTDNCPGVTDVCDPPSGSDFPVGDTLVTCTATDVGGNDVSCTFTVTVNAVAAPTATATAEASPVPAGGVTTLPSTGTAPSDSNSDLVKWGPLAAIGGAAAFVAARLRKTSPVAEDES